MSFLLIAYCIAKNRMLKKEKLNCYCWCCFAIELSHVAARKRRITSKSITENYKILKEVDKSNSCVSEAAKYIILELKLD